MASITKTAKGYRAQLYVSGDRDSQTFRTKREAEAWATRRESELREDKRKQPGEKVTLRELLLRYRDEVTPHRRGRKWETTRINRFDRDGAESGLPLGLPCVEILPEHIAAWRDMRRNQVQASTVLRELSLLSGIFQHAKLEWRLIESNPVHDVRKPAQKDHREVVIHRWQVAAMLRAANYRHGKRPKSVGQAIAYTFLVALRTGMRAGELCGLTWARVYDDYCETPHKTGKTEQSLRRVPLEPRAKRLIERMRGWDDELVFGVAVGSLDTMFRKFRKKVKLSGFTFHDSRHTAATWLARRVDVLTLCKIFGWSRVDQALTYYNPTASDIAKQINAGRQSPRQSR